LDRQFSLLDIYKLILQGDMGRFPYGIWKEDSIKKECVDVIRYFVENILQCDQEEIPQKATFSQFRKYRLYGMIKNVFNQSTYEAIDAAYPGRFKMGIRQLFTPQLDQRLCCQRRKMAYPGKTRLVL